MIIWIASYPKSGNTWVRSFLTSYLFNTNEKFNLRLLDKIDQFPRLKNFVDINEDPQNLLDISKLWITAQNRINLSNKITFLKTHHAMCTIQNNPFTNKDNTLGAIYIVRDPRDIVISYSHHIEYNYKDTIDRMISEKMQTVLFDDKKERTLALIGNWSENYNSWKNFNIQKKIIVKYEDLVNQPLENFFKIIQFLSSLYDLKVDEGRVKECIEITSFSNLQNLERKFGFKERVGKKELFFRTGKTNQWKQKLEKKDVLRLENAFKDEMRELGYI